MQYPVTLKVMEQRPREISGTTENVSELGILLVSDAEVPPTSRVELALTLQHESMPAVRLLSSGTVFRVEPRPGNKKAIAIGCDQAFQPV